MFETLDTLPADPILGLNQAFHQDSNPDKINLSVGVYQDDDGKTPIFTAVKKAEQRLLDQQTSKSYVAQAGDPVYLKQITRLLLGDELVNERGDRIESVVTTGGSGAVRMCAELLAQANRTQANRTKAKKNIKVWVGDPTWANHYPLLQSAGLEVDKFAYYDHAKNGIDFAAMTDALQQIPEGDAVLLHGCCHNPTGADITSDQWDVVIDILEQRKLLPFIDMAYQGFGAGLDEDAYGLRKTISQCPEVLIAASCSKNFGLYRERTGVAIVVTESSKQSNAAKSHIMSNARQAYSMPPYHGSAITGLLLSDESLTIEWKAELETMRNSMDKARQNLASGLNGAQSVIDFSFVARSRGMFCFLGIPREDVLKLRSEYGIYLLESTRINVAGLSDENTPVVVERVAEMLLR